jgi:hypothetical protein
VGKRFSGMTKSIQVSRASGGSRWLADAAAAGTTRVTCSDVSLIARCPRTTLRENETTLDEEKTRNGI